MNPEDVITLDDLIELLQGAARGGAEYSTLRTVLLRSGWWWQCRNCGEVHRHTVGWCQVCGAIPLRRRTGQQTLWVDVPRSSRAVHRPVDNPSHM